MMKSAEDRLSGEFAEPMGRRILVQGRMRSEPVIAGVDRKNLAQMGLAEGDDVIEAFPADRADQSLRTPILARVTSGAASFRAAALGVFSTSIELSAPSCALYRHLLR
jgi:hypothetical protein